MNSLLCGRAARDTATLRLDNHTLEKTPPTDNKRNMSKKSRSQKKAADRGKFPAAHPRPGKPRVARRAAIPLTVTSAAKAHAADYYSQLVDPFRARLARVPDQITAATALFESVTRLSVVTGVGPTGAYETTLVVSPYITTSTSGGASEKINQISWTSGTATQIVTTDPIAASVTANFAQVRPCAMGVRLIQNTPILNRGGSLFVFQNPQSIIPTMGGFQAQFSTALSSPTTDVYDLATLPSNEYWIWRPNKLIDLDFSFLLTSGNTTLPPLVLGVLGSVSASFTIEVLTVYEGVPLNSTAALFDVEAIVGDPSGVSEVQEACRQASVGTNQATPSSGMKESSYADLIAKTWDGVRPYARRRIVHALRSYAGENVFTDAAAAAAGFVLG